MLPPIDCLANRVVITADRAIEATAAFPTKLDFIAHGTYGVVVGDGKVCAKLTDCTKIEADEIELAWGLSKKGLGPKLFSFGLLELPTKLLEELCAPIPTKEIPYFNVEEPIAEIVYVCYEQWECTLEKALETIDISQETIGSVLPKWKASIEQIHRFGYYHLDVMPRNILVRTNNGKITDLCIADCGIATKNNFWFLNSHYRYEDRFNVIDRFTKVQGTEPLRKEIEAAGRGTKIPIKKRFHYWLLHEPKNIDFCIYATICHLIGKPELYPVVFPQEFNYSLPWDPCGMLNVQVQTNKVKHNFWLCGFDSLARFRNILEASEISHFKNLNFTSAKGIVPKCREASTLPSCVLKRKKGGDRAIFIKMV